MKAIIYTEYGNPDVLKVQDMPKPVPKDGEVLVKVHAVAVNFGDIMARNFIYISAKEFNMPLLLWLFAKLAFGIRKPRIKVLGNSFSGEIESDGRKGFQLQKGEPVFGYTGEKMGGYAEYVCLPSKGIIASKPSIVSFAQAAALPYGSLVAINLLKKIKISKGQKVLVVGASGSIGSATIQLLRNHFGAVVSGVCRSERMDYVKRLGVETVFDYEKGNYAQDNETYDIIIDVLGKGSFSGYKSILKPDGTCIYASFKTLKLLQMLWTRLTGNRKVRCILTSASVDDLVLIKKLVEEGKITAVIDRSYPFEKASDAHAYYESHCSHGDVIVTFQK